MVNYNNGKIYKIVCDITNKTYYGSTTTTLCRRLGQHKTQKGIVQYGMTNPKIYLVEDFSCDRKEQLFKRERFFIENNECINKNIPTRTRKEYREDNKELIKKTHKIYEENHKEDISSNKKKYYINNKEFISLRQKAIINCDCGSSFTVAGKSLHSKSQKHIKYVNSL